MIRSINEINLFVRVLKLRTAAAAVNNKGVVVGKSNFYPVIWKYDVANASSTPAIQKLPIPSGFFAAVPTGVNDFADVAGYGAPPT